VFTAPSRPLRNARLADRQAGAAAVELALVLPILLLLVFGIVDFGRAYNAQISLTQAAREGARARALGADAAATTARVQLAAGFLPATSVSVGAGTPCPASPTSTDVATVTATSTFTFVTPIGALAGFAAGPLTLTGTGVMRCLG
jgi:Flp pilus assembly protein TadG